MPYSQHGRIKNAVLRTTLSHIKTHNRKGVVEAPTYVNFRLLERAGVCYRLDAAEGFRIVGAMINTVRYHPRIEDVVCSVEAHVITLVFLGSGRYKIAEFTAINDTAVHTGPWNAFELTEVIDG